MATRPVFITLDKPPYYKEIMIDFTFYSGFAEVQKKRSIKSLHEAYLKLNEKGNILEISSKSENVLGVKLSAFNLMIETKDGKKISVESAFQGSKVFEKGGPYCDLLYKSSREAKKDLRLKESGKLIYFYFINKKFDLIPRTFFYNWLYINTLNLYADLSSDILVYDSFTDIEFNPEKSINCQAMAAAIFVSLKKQGLLEEAIRDKESFLKAIYSISSNNNESINEDPKQLCFLDNFK